MKYVKSFNESLGFKKSRSRLFIRNYLNENPGTDYWHTLTEMGYKEWQNKKSDVNSLNDMMEFTKEKYGELVEFAILLGNYIGQVNNGGHYQYYDNGYAGSGGGSFGSHGDDMENHNRLIELYIELKDDLGEKEWYVPLLDIMESFDIRLNDEEYVDDQCEDCDYGSMECEECYGSGELDGDEESEECGSCDGQGSVECNYCDGSGNVETENEEYNEPDYSTIEEWKSLDTKLYDLDGKYDFDKVFNEYFESIIS